MRQNNFSVKESIQDMFRIGDSRTEHNLFKAPKNFFAGIGELRKSMRLRIFLVIVMTAWIPLLAVNEYVFSQYLNKETKSLTETLQYESLTLSRQMSRSSYLANAQDNPSLNNSMNAQINAMADFFNGRIQVIDAGFVVIKDTYNMDTGKYNISSAVLATFKDGETVEYQFRQASGFVEFTIPLYDESLTLVRGAIVCTAALTDIEESVEKLQKSAQVLEFALCILILLIGFGGSFLLMRPLKRLEKELNRATQGDLEPISVSDCMETRAIAGVYNESLLRLKHLDESRQEFVSNVSHELKTPITSMRILADTLTSMGEAPVELYQEFMTDISQEIDRESRIIDDLLEMVRLDKKEATLSVTRLNVNELLESVLKRLMGIAEQRDVKVSLECLREVEADVDELKFTRMITNLVENAIKYNKDSGSVDVTLNADQTYFYIKIVDTGVGIPEDEINQIFERFHRVDKARSRETGGTGLGLAICKNIAQLHHGVIRVNSVYGEGSTFVVRIPLIYIP